MLKIDLQSQKKVSQKFFFPLGFALVSFFISFYVIENNKFLQFDNDSFKILCIVVLGIAIGFGIEFLQLSSRKKRIYARLGACLFIALQIILVLNVVSRKFSYLYLNFFLLVHLFVALSFWFRSKNSFKFIYRNSDYNDRTF